FVKFCEETLNLQRTRLEKVPGPPDQATLRTLDREFAQEWTDQFDQFNLPEAFQARHCISTLASQCLTVPSAAPATDPPSPLFWRLQVTRPEDGAPPYCCGVVCVAKTARQALIEPGAQIGPEAE